jgi:ergothioneine biosynthesis protein EgtB
MTSIVANEPARRSMLNRYLAVRRFTESLCAPLSPEDCAIQSMPDASPARWHLAHTTWFFETFVLKRASAEYEPFHPAFGHLFNSYYNSVGATFPRSQRSLLSRPSLSEVLEYRGHVDRHVRELLDGDAELGELPPIIELGMHHEQQHQELILTDIKHLLSLNPLQPRYRETAATVPGASPPIEWNSFPAGVRWIGYSGDDFAFDNETPRHRVSVESFRIGSRLVTNEDYVAFMEDGGYRRPELWLAAGWDVMSSQGWQTPLYWTERDGRWCSFTLGGLRPLAGAEPVCHVSFFEADAYARWSGARLPTEAEWETAAENVPLDGNFVESEALHPRPASSGMLSHPTQMFGDVWEWTASPYVAYPGFQPWRGSLGEYNGKFMCNQYVLRGGSCATPRAHIRRSYRNFFPPDARWQFTGIRLAGDNT